MGNLIIQPIKIIFPHPNTIYWIGTILGISNKPFDMSILQFSCLMNIHKILKKEVFTVWLEVYFQTNTIGYIVLK